MTVHLNLVKKYWADRQDLLKDGSQVVLDGDSLSLGAVVAVSRYVFIIGNGMRWEKLRRPGILPKR